MKIYKYKATNIPNCVNLSRGHYYSEITHEKIGFGDGTIPPDSNTKEITLQELIDWANEISGESSQTIIDFVNKITSASENTFYGKVVFTQKQVKNLAQEKINTVFYDPEKKLTNAQYKEALIEKMICILLADSGRITYDQANIPGVINKKTSDDYIATILPIWMQAAQIRTNSEQFITEHNLQ